MTATRGEGSKNSEILWMAYPVILSSIERGEEQGTKGRSKREKHVEKNAALNELNEPHKKTDPSIDLSC